MRFWNYEPANGTSHSGSCHTITRRWRRWPGKTASRNWHRRSRPAGSGEQPHRIDGLLLQLIQRALPRRLVRAPAQDRGAMAKAFAAEMIVGHFDDQLR